MLLQQQQHYILESLSLSSARLLSEWRYDYAAEDGCLTLEINNSRAADELRHRRGTM